MIVVVVVVVLVVVVVIVVVAVDLQKLDNKYIYIYVYIHGCFYFVLTTAVDKAVGNSSCFTMVMNDQLVFGAQQQNRNYHIEHHHVSLDSA